MPFARRLLLVLALVLSPGAARAAKHAAHAKPKAKTAAKSCPAPKDEPPPIVVAGGKVAVFPFTGDDAEPVRRQVMHLLKAKGMKVMTNLRPVDSAEQYREMAVTLNLVGYVDGEFVGDGDQASATVYVRSGVTGLRSVSTTFAGERRTLPAEVGKGLWDRISPDLARLCVEAAKPRKAERAPLRIEAGTPLENHPGDD